MSPTIASTPGQMVIDNFGNQGDGIEEVKAECLYKGRPEDTERNKAIGDMLAKGQSWSTIQAATGCSRSTIARLAKRAATGEGG